MKTIINILFSFRLMAFLLVIFACTIAIATFVESKYGTPTAHTIVYQSIWFQLLLILWFINLSGIIIANRLYRKGKFSVFILHVSFLLILLGAATTRFFGQDGYMHIREGESSKIMISDDVYLQVAASSGKHGAYKDEKTNFSAIGKNLYQLVLNLEGKKIEVKCLEFIPNAELTPQGFLSGKVISDSSYDALQFRINYQDQTKTIWYIARHGMINNPVLIQIADLEVNLSFGAKKIELPFSLLLRKFILERYPGSESPSWFESKVLLHDPLNKLNEEHRIFMNNVLTYQGYRFFQSSYDTDEHGTILSVNHDFWGTLITYLGYGLLAVSILLSLFNPTSRFRKLYRDLSLQEFRKVPTTIILLILLSLGGSINCWGHTTLNDSLQIDQTHASKFGELLVQDPGGRIKPLNTFSSEIVRKITYQISYQGLTSDQLVLGMMVFPEYWQQQPMIRVSNPDIQKVLHINRNYVSFQGVFDLSTNEHKYLLGYYVKSAYQKKPSQRSKFDTEMIRLNERVSLAYQIYTVDYMRIFPNKQDPHHTWFTPLNAATAFHGNDSIFTVNILQIYFQLIHNAAKSKNWTKAEEVLGMIHDYQIKNGTGIIPSPMKVKLEILYNHINIFEQLIAAYGWIGFILLIFEFLTVFFQHLKLKTLIRISTILIGLGFVIHGIGLITRWYISGHAPWSNAYESLLYIAFATVLAGILFSNKSGIVLAVGALLGSLILFVAHLDWMDPEITNLVPVLKSYWLLIHVAIITASYGFLALGAILAFINLLTMSLQSPSNIHQTQGIINQLTMIIEMTLIIGLYMLTLGTFLGGVWANESWGHYWSWDPKETWALVSVLVYAFITHMRMIPGLKGDFLFNFMALLGYSSIIMTYFGVNYYLTGLHSYAKGDPMPIPTFVYYTLSIIAITSISAWLNQRKIKHNSLN